MKVSIAISALLDELKTVSADPDPDKKCAEAICSFAERVSNEVLDRVGFDPETTLGDTNTGARYANQLAQVMDSEFPTRAPKEVFMELMLHDVPGYRSALSAWRGSKLDSPNCKNS